MCRVDSCQELGSLCCAQTPGELCWASAFSPAFVWAQKFPSNSSAVTADTAHKALSGSWIQVRSLTVILFCLLFL